MPELPEVETTVRTLAKHITGLKITDFWFDRPNIMRHGDLKHEQKKILDQKITNVRRRAKYIVLDLGQDKSLFIHQKMSGHLLYGNYAQSKNIWKSLENGHLQDPKNQHIRLVFGLSNGKHLVLSDTRRFGKIILLHSDNKTANAELNKLGPEPLEVSKKDFLELFRRKHGALKPTLMDPNFIVGIGNIYADEILWKVGLHPKSRIENLKERHINDLYEATQSILKLAIKHKGSSMDDYRTPYGDRGQFQNYHRVYQKTGTACLKKDRGIIERIRFNGRSAHFCPVHQKII